MKNPIQISIPTPCHEDWDKMTSTDKGRFCASCQKNVWDFTRSSDREIAAVFAKEANLCGRFLPSQLERELEVPQEKSPVWSAAAAIVAMMSFGTSGVSAQTPLATEQQIPDETSSKMTEPSSLIVSGTITDFSGPLPNVAVTIKETQACEMTDSNGKYSIDVCSGQTIIFSHRGFILQENTIADPDLGAVDISFEAGQLLDEIVVTGYRETTRRQMSMTGVVTVTSTKRRTFFGRIFHAIGNLFR